NSLASNAQLQRYGNDYWKFIEKFESIRNKYADVNNNEWLKELFGKSFEDLQKQGFTSQDIDALRAKILQYLDDIWSATAEGIADANNNLGNIFGNEFYSSLFRFGEIEMNVEKSVILARISDRLEQAVREKVADSLKKETSQEDAINKRQTEINAAKVFLNAMRTERNNLAEDKRENIEKDIEKLEADIKAAEEQLKNASAQNEAMAKWKPVIDAGINTKVDSRAKTLIKYLNMSIGKIIKASSMLTKSLLIGAPIAFLSAALIGLAGFGSAALSPALLALGAAAFVVVLLVFFAKPLINKFNYLSQVDGTNDSLNKYAATGDGRYRLGALKSFLYKSLSSVTQIAGVVAIAALALGFVFSSPMLITAAAANALLALAAAGIFIGINIFNKARAERKISSDKSIKSSLKKAWESIKAANVPANAQQNQIKVITTIAVVSLIVIAAAASFAVFGAWAIVAGVAATGLFVVSQFAGKKFAKDTSVISSKTWLKFGIGAAAAFIGAAVLAKLGILTAAVAGVFFGAALPVMLLLGIAGGLIYFLRSDYVNKSIDMMQNRSKLLGFLRIFAPLAVIGVSMGFAVLKGAALLGALVSFVNPVSLIIGAGLALVFGALLYFDKTRPAAQLLLALLGFTVPLSGFAQQAETTIAMEGVLKKAEAAQKEEETKEVVEEDLAPETAEVLAGAQQQDVTEEQPAAPAAAPAQEPQAEVRQPLISDAMPEAPVITLGQTDVAQAAQARAQETQQERRSQTPALAEEAIVREAVEVITSAKPVPINPFYAIDDSYRGLFGGQGSAALSGLLSSMGQGSAGVQKFLTDFPEAAGAAAFVEAYVNQAGSEGMRNAFSNVQRFNDAFYKWRQAAALADQFHNQAPINISNMDFSAMDASEIVPIASIIILLNDAMTYADQSNGNNARVEFSNMRQSITDKAYGSMKVDDPRQQKFAYFDAADLRKADQPALRSYLAQNNNNAKMAFDRIMFDFLFINLQGLPANYVITDSLREAMIADFNMDEALAITDGNGTIIGWDLSKWENKILDRYGRYVFLDALSQAERNHTTSQDWINLGKIITEIPAAYSNITSNTDLVLNANASGDFRGNARANANLDVPVFSPLFAQGGIGRTFSGSLKRIVSSGFSDAEINSLRSGFEQYNLAQTGRIIKGEALVPLQKSDAEARGLMNLYGVENESRILRNLDVSMIGAAIDAYAMKEYGVGSLSEGLRSELIRRYSAELNAGRKPDILQWIKIVADTEVTLDVLSQKIEVKGKKQGYSYFQEVRALRAKLTESAIRVGVWFHTERQTADILRNADRFLADEGKKELKELNDLIDDLPGSLDWQISQRSDYLLGILRANNYDVKNSLYSILSDKFFIEPAIAADGRVVGWSWGNRENGRHLTWGKRPASGVTYFDRWHARERDGQQPLTFDALLANVENSPEFANQKVEISNIDYFNMRLAFMSSSETDFNARMAILINAYREANLKGNLNRALAAKDFNKIYELSFKGELIERGYGINTNIDLIAQLRDGYINEGAPLSKDALIECIMDLMKNNLHAGYQRPSSGLASAIFADYEKTGSVRQTLEKFKNDIVFESWKEYVRRRQPSALQVLAPIGALFLPRLSNELNEQIASAIPAVVTVENLSISAGVSVMPGPKSTPTALFRSMVEQDWSDADLAELGNMLASWQNTQTGGYSYYTESYFRQESHDNERTPAYIRNWINERGANFIRQYIRDQIPAEYGMTQLDDAWLFGDNLESAIVNNYQFNAYVDLDRQAQDFWRQYEGDIWLNILKRIVGNDNDYSRAVITSENLGKKYSNNEQRRIIDIRTLVERVETLRRENPSSFKYYNTARKIDGILEDAREELEDYASDITAIMTQSGRKTRELINLLKREGKTVNTQEAELILSRERYNVANAVEVAMGRKLSEHSQFNADEIMTFSRVFMASQISEEYQMSNKLRNEMLKYLAENLNSPENAGKSNWQLAMVLVGEFSRDISVEVMQQYKEGKIVTFKDVFFPALMAVGSLIPFGIGTYVRLAAQSAELLFPGISGQNLINKINQSGYLINDAVKRDMLRLNASGQTQRLHVYSERQERNAREWFNKNERENVRQLLQRWVESDLGISGIIEIRLPNRLLDGYSYDANRDPAEVFNEYLSSLRNDIYLQALNEIVKKVQVPTAEDTALFNAMMRAKKYFDATYPQGAYPQNIREAIQKVDAAVAKRSDIVSGKLSLLKTKLGDITRDDAFLTRELVRHYYDVDDTLEAVRALSAATPSTTAQRVSAQVRTASQSQPILYDNQRMDVFLQEMAAFRNFYENPLIKNQISKYFSALRNDQEARELANLLIMSQVLAAQNPNIEQALTPELRNTAIAYLPAFASTEIKAAYEAIRRAGTQDAKLADLNAKFQTLRDHLNFYHAHLNAEISQSINSPATVGNIRLLKEAAKEIVRIQRQVLAIQAEISRLQRSQGRADFARLGGL
ncbi:MAG: hypothetical protein LBO62_06880, partial [Endomicrobium sp.]|nr:hypothetical protein [Endomicrobium sp.]